MRGRFGEEGTRAGRSRTTGTASRPQCRSASHPTMSCLPRCSRSANPSQHCHAAASAAAS
eukprot:5200529-Lingulodinium_polyedra.AAC.1